MFFIFPLQENKRIGGISFNLFFFLKNCEKISERKLEKLEIFRIARRMKREKRRFGIQKDKYLLIFLK